MGSFKIRFNQSTEEQDAFVDVTPEIEKMKQDIASKPDTLMVGLVVFILSIVFFVALMAATH